MPETTRDRRRLHYEAEGEGRTVVLIPGIGSGRKLFGTLPRRFARAGLRCVTFDPVGVPPSSPHEADDYDFAAAADDVWAVADAAGADQVDRVGTSLGGKVGLVAAARAPQRARSLVMLGSATAVGARAERVYRFFATVAEKLDPEDFGTVIAPFLFGSTFHAERPQLVDDIVRAIRPGPEVRRLMAAQARGLRAFDPAPWIALWRGPTLCLAGGEDTLTPPAEVRATATSLANARYVEIPDAGHSLLLESRRVFDEVLAFLGAL